MRNRKILLISGLILLCCGSWGCTIGPRIATKYIIVHPGKPIEVLENRKIKGILLEDPGDPVTMDIGGWVAMPPEHWEAVTRALKNN